ncbi:MAG TPA: response regulator transcription factor, partial [Chloroflexota bacterium]
GLRMRLGREVDLAIVGEAEDGPQAIEVASALRPDVVLLDVALPGADGISVAGRLRTLVPDTRVVMLSLYDDAITRDRARAAGATTLVGKHEPLPNLLRAIRGVPPPDS